MGSMATMTTRLLLPLLTEAEGAEISEISDMDLAALRA